MNGVTVLIPVYNEVKHIEQAVLSVVKQVEVVLISDNCSDDGTQEVCKRLVEKFGNIVFYEQSENIGSIKNFEFLLSKVVTKYTLHIGAHDYVGDNYVNVLKNCLEKNPTAVVAFSPFCSVDDCGKILDENLLNEVGERLLSPNKLERIFTIIEEYKKCIFTIFGLFRTKMLRKNYNPLVVAGADCLLLCKCIAEGEFLKCDTVRFYRRIVSREESSQTYMKRIQGDSISSPYDLSYMCEHQLKLIVTMCNHDSEQKPFLLAKANTLMQKLFSYSSPRALQLTLDGLQKKDEKYILYGAGSGSDAVIKKIKEKLVFIVDIDALKHGTKKNDLDVRGLDYLKKYPYKIIISQFGRFDLIAKELISTHGIDKERLIYPVNYLLFLEPDAIKIDINKSFSSAVYWKERYARGGNSGAGSYNHLARFKADIINNFVKTHRIDNVLELGCGDGNNLSLYDIEHYVGVDVAERAVELCREKFKYDATKSFFTKEEFSAFKEQKKKADTVISLDVIFHLVEDVVYTAYMQSLFDYANKYVLVYSSNKNERLSKHVRHRKFTNWIAEKQPNWKLKMYIQNRYPYDENKPNETSFSDFYIYERKNGSN